MVSSQNTAQEIFFSKKREENKVDRPLFLKKKKKKRSFLLGKSKWLATKFQYIFEDLYLGYLTICVL